MQKYFGSTSKLPGYDQYAMILCCSISAMIVVLVDYCAQRPCQFGTCIPASRWAFGSAYPSFICNCTTGFTGRLCTHGMILHWPRDEEHDGKCACRLMFSLFPVESPLFRSKYFSKYAECIGIANDADLPESLTAVSNAGSQSNQFKF